jgi:hypothetical protein
MATTSTPAQRKYVEFDEFIDFQLQKTRHGIKTNDILTALAGVATLFLAYLLVFVVFDHWIVDGGFSPVGRWLMLGGLLVVCAVWVVWRVVIPSRKHVTGLYAARAIETTEPGLKHTLLNLVDLRRAGRKVPEDIARAMEKRAAVTLSKTDVDSAVDRRPLMRLSYTLLALVLICCLYSLFSPKKISASVWRALFPSAATAVDTAIKIDKVAVEYRGRQHDPDVTLPARSRPEVIVDLGYSGAAPEQVVLYYSTADDKYRDVPVPMRPDAKEPKRYRVRLTGESNRGILQNTSYRIEAGDAKAGPFQITVVRPPIATVKQVRYVYPKYMERDPKTQEGGHIETWEGTAVTVTARTDQPVTDAWLVFTDTEDVSKPAAKTRMTIAGGTGLSVELKREIAFREDGSYPRFYHIECVGKNGFKDPRPALYGVTIRRDLPPVIELLDPPGTERDVPANTQTLPLLYKARDPDFKLRSVTLRAELSRAGNGGNPEEFDEQPFHGLKREIQAAWDWTLGRMRLKAGDTVRFRLEAMDNRQPKGNRTFTRWVTLRIVEPVSKDKAEQQLKADRQRQQQIQQEQEKNQGDQNAGEQKNDQQPMDNQGNKPQPKDGPKGKTRGKGKSANSTNNGTEGQPKPGKSGQPKNATKEPKDGGEDGNSKEKNPNGKPKKGVNQQPPKDDEDLIKRALREQKQKERKKGKQEGTNNPKGRNPEGNDPGNTNQKPQDGHDSNAGQKPGPKQKQPGQARDSNAGKTDLRKKESSQPGNPPQPKQQGETPGKKKGMPPPPKADGPQKQDATGASGTKAGAKNDGGKEKPKGGGTGAPLPKKDTGMEDNAAGNSTAKSGKKKKYPNVGNGKPRSKTNDANGGPRQTVEDNGKPAKKQTATGDETGVAKPNPNPKAQPTPSKKPDQIKRSDQTKPVIRKSKSSGKPKQGMTTGSDNPDPTKPKTSKKSIPPNPDVRKTQSKDNSQTPAAKQSSDHKDPGNRKLQGKGPPKGRKSKNSDGGKNGMGKSSDQGIEGSKQQGAGDKTNRNGQRQEANKKTSRPGQKSGKGSTSQSRDTGKSGAKQSSQSKGQSGKSSNGSPMGGRNGNTPGNSGSARNTFPKRKNARDIGGAGNGAGREGANPPPDLPDPEKADLNYGRNASNLVLNRMEDRLKRGKLTDAELKKLGFSSRQEAQQWLDRVKKRIASPDPQFAEFLKSIRDMKFQSEVGKRSGQGVHKKTIKGEGNTGRENVPPRLRLYYDAFRRSVNNR